MKKQKQVGFGIADQKKIAELEREYPHLKNYTDFSKKVKAIFMEGIKKIEEYNKSLLCSLSRVTKVF